MWVIIVYLYHMEGVINHFCIYYSLQPYNAVDKAKIALLLVAYQPLLGKLAWKTPRSYTDITTKRSVTWL